MTFEKNVRANQLCTHFLSSMCTNTKIGSRLQCWTEGQRSTAVAEDLRPTATMAEVLGNFYGRRSYL